MAALDVTLKAPEAAQGMRRSLRPDEPQSFSARLGKVLAPDLALDNARSVQSAFEALIAAGLGELPQPGAGHTLARWSALAQVASRSLSLVKLYEAHTDALAIDRELLTDVARPGRWGVFAAEGPRRLVCEGTGGTVVRLTGAKSWCSGGGYVSHALMTARTPKGVPFLVSVALENPTVTRVFEGWKSIGMAATETCELHFVDTAAKVVGAPNAYIERPGFWHGAIGIAACWYGGASALADATRRALLVRNDPHGLAHLGAIAAQLSAARSALICAAQRIDLHPRADAHALALTTRAVVEAACSAVLEHAGRALGARPFCTDSAFAMMAADLPVFMRQSHAEQDLEALGDLILTGDPAWTQLN